MHNQEIAWALSQMADFMEILGENPHKVRAFRKGAQAVELLETPAMTLLPRGQLEKVPGLGSSLIGQIRQMIQEGESDLQRDLKNRIPPGVLEMLRLPGIGIRSVQEFFARGISTLEELEEAAKAHKVRKMRGMGAKTELAILRGLDMLRRRSGKFSIGVARPVAVAFVEALKNLPEVERAEIAGGVRRGREMVGEAHIIVATNEVETVLNVMRKHPSIMTILEFTGLLARLLLV